MKNYCKTFRPSLPPKSPIAKARTSLRKVLNHKYYHLTARQLINKTSKAPAKKHCPLPHQFALFGHDLDHEI